ncbi:MAG: hypothetical protein H0X24_20005 [Ktedonobacterales bacterium]|nr:hypothetical protein [Ktedonobacterales bacterium]
MLNWERLAERHPYEALRRLLTLGGVALVAAFAATAPALADDRPDGAEMATAGSMMIVIAAAFVVAGLGLVWSWKNGEYDEPEEIKYQMMAMVEDEPDYWGMGAHDAEDEAEEEALAQRPLLARPAVG